MMFAGMAAPVWVRSCPDGMQVRECDEGTLLTGVGFGDDVGHRQVGAESVTGLGFDVGVAAGQRGVQAR